MSGQNLTRAAITWTTALLFGITPVLGQEISEPLPSTPNPAGSVLPPDEADGVSDNDVDRPARPGIVPERDVERPAARPRQSAPMTAEDVQTWQQIATLHEQFVRSHVPGAADNQNISRTDPNRQRLQQLWERLAEIERQLIVSGAYNDEIGTRTTLRVRPVPRGDLDEIPDPLTATNQRVPASANDEDQSTARALAQEDRSLPPDPVIRDETVREAARRDPLTAEAVEDAIERRAGVDEVAQRPAETGSLWQEFIDVRRQILIAEITAARGIAGQE